MKYIPSLRNQLTIALLLMGSYNSFAQLSPMVIGTILPGDSVVIYYDVTINSGAGSQVSNQGTLTGSNFATFTTDDPDTGPLGDPTITALNVFPLPVTLYSLSAAQKGNGVEVAWQVTAESNLLKYDVEKSNDGRSFTKIGEVAAQNNGQNTRYTFADATVSSGTHYYRLKVIDRSAAGRYSVVVKVDLAGKAGGMAVFPNPAVQKQITLQLNDMSKGSYKLELYNGSGQPVYSQAIQHSGGSLSRGFTLPQALPAGMYFVKVRSEAGVFTQQLLIK
jgi:hypothetical protein